MPTDSDKLRHAVAALHDALAGAGTVDPETRRLLGETLAEIHQTLDRRAQEPTAAGARAKDSSSVVGRLSTAAEEFEGTHPTLAGLVGSVIDALSRMGI
ncbi:MAG: DUF4404 family protein [Pirellulales bacterium]|nr:DUF4404 family protein [Pirellulales bacterium]